MEECPGPLGSEDGSKQDHHLACDTAGRISSAKDAGIMLSCIGSGVHFEGKGFVVDQHQPGWESTEQAPQSTKHGHLMQAGYFSNPVPPSVAGRAGGSPDAVCGKFEEANTAGTSYMSGPLCQNSGRTYMCSTCGKSFAGPNSLSKHRRVHNSARRFACETCGRAFLHARDLERHMLTHTGLRPFACATCGKAFSRSSDLTTHKRTHSGDRPFKCPTCGRAFAQSANLVKHRRSKHSFEGSTNGQGAGSL
jgi:DNA-directed RNA polymerase subunit RPC12/RpoP